MSPLNLLEPLEPIEPFEPALNLFPDRSDRPGRLTPHADAAVLEGGEEAR